MREKLKFKKLLNEFRSLEYEFEYNSEVLREAGEAFESYYLKWCDENSVDIAAIQKEKNKKTQIKNPQPLEDDSAARTEVRKKHSKHRDVFKSIAKKIHPDKIQDHDPRKDEFNDAFLRANSAIDNGEWGGLFDVIDKYDIDIQDYDSANESLTKDIQRMNDKLKSQKSTYSWLLQNCGDDTLCRDIIIRAYMSQVYGWSEDKES